MEFNTTDTISQIAMSLGIYDVSNFTKFFRSHKGITPSEYRERCKHT